MRAVDEKGRLFGKISIIDIIIVFVALALGAGFVFQRASGDISRILNADEKFYVTFRGDRVRSFSVGAIGEGDVVFRRYDSQPIGPVVNVWSEPGTEIMLRTDGSAVVAEMEDRYTLYITVECTGRITEKGYHVNGSMHLAEGNEAEIQTNRLRVNSIVHRIDDAPPTR